MPGRTGVSVKSIHTANEALRVAELALRLDETDRARQSFERLASGAGPAAVRARAEAGIGQLAFLEDDARTAIRHLERAYELDPELDDPAVAETLGRAYARIGLEEDAAVLFRRQLGRAEERHDRVGRLRFTLLLANTLIDATEFSEATSLLSRAIADVPSGDPLALARVRWSQARLHAHRGETEVARRNARQALELLEGSEHTVYTARACQALAHIELDAGNAEEALVLVERGRELLAGSGTDSDESAFMLEEARAFAQLGLLDEAVSLAMASARFVGAHPVDVGRSYAELAAALDRSGDISRALEVYELAIELHEKRPSVFLVEAYARQADLLERMGKRAEAFAGYKRAAMLRAQLAR